MASCLVGLRSISPVPTIDNAAGVYQSIWRFCVMGKVWNGKTESMESIPEAPYYVLSNDKCMSGWGMARSKINMCVVPCNSREMAEAVKSYVQTRPEQKYIRIVCNPPRTKSPILYSLCLGWIERAREHSNLRPEYITW